MGSRVIFALTDVQADALRIVAAKRELSTERLRRAFYALRHRKLVKGSTYGTDTALTPLGTAAVRLLERLEPKDG